MKKHTRYFIRQAGGNIQGPFDAERVHRLIRQGKATARMHYSLDGRVWCLGSDLPELPFGRSARPPKRRASTRGRRRSNPIWTVVGCLVIVSVTLVLVRALQRSSSSEALSKPDQLLQSPKPEDPVIEAERVDASDRHAALLRAAERGDAWARYDLGAYYYEGRGIPRDEQEAVRWWRMAAEQGHALAKFRLRKLEAAEESATDADPVSDIPGPEGSQGPAGR